MSREFNPPVRLRELEAIILQMLAKGIATTEELRVACCDTKPVVYGRLKALEERGLIQGSNGANAKAGKPRRWRLNPKTSTRAAAG